MTTFFFHGGVAIPPLPSVEPSNKGIAREKVGNDELNDKIVEALRRRDALSSTLSPPFRDNNPPVGQAIKTIDAYLPALSFLESLYREGRRSVTNRLSFAWNVYYGGKRKTVAVQSAKCEIALLLTLRSYLLMRASTLFLDSAPNKTSFEEAANCSVENFLECAAMHEYILASQVDRPVNIPADLRYAQYQKFLVSLCLGYASFVALRKAQAKDFLPEVVARLSSAVFHHFEEASHSLDSLGRAEKFIDPAIGEFIRTSVIAHRAYTWKAWANHLWNLKEHGNAIACLNAANKALERLRGPKDKRPLPSFAGAVLGVVEKQKEEYMQLNFEKFGADIPSEEKAETFFPGGKDIFPEKMKYELPPPI